jgi:phosphatidyl-myo-inositol dimannoside synthase
MGIVRARGRVHGGRLKLPGEDVGGNAVMLLATEAYGSYGGVQTYMRLLIRLLGERGAAGGLRPIALALNDGMRSIPQAAGSGVTVWNGRGRKLPFVLRTLRDGIAHKPRLVIAGHLALAPTAWLLQLLGLAKHFIIVLHGIESWKRNGLLIRLASRRATVIVATTDYTIREFCYYNRVGREKVRIIPLSAEHAIPPTPVRDASQRPFRLLCVSRLTAGEGYKGIDAVFEAAQELIQTGYSVHVDLVGDGSDRLRLEQLAGQLRLNGSVTFHGRATPTQLDRLYAQAHLFAMPSKKEGFGIVFLEAMQHHMPVLGGNHGGTPEVIEHTVDGFLVEYAAVSEIVFYVAALIDDPSLYSSMAKNAAVNVQKKFSPACFFREWSRMIASV